MIEEYFSCHVLALKDATIILQNSEVVCMMCS